jgi:phage terminase large subunit-like protein
MIKGYDKEVFQIEEEILSGKRIAGDLLKRCIERHREDLINGHERSIWFSVEIGAEVLEFSENLSNYRGDPTTRLFWWQRLELYYSFGWRRKDIDMRRYNTFYTTMARKNQKTITRAPKIFYHLLFEDEFKAEVYISATKEDQAKICFDDIKAIKNNTPELSEMYGSTAERIFSHEHGSKIGFLTSNPKTADGTRPTYAVVDEYHEFDNDGMPIKLRTGMINRRHKILEYITTRGNNKSKPCYIKETQLFIPILKGQIIDDSTLVMIFAPNIGMDIFQEGTSELNLDMAYMANPNLGDTIPVDQFKEDFNKAVNEGSVALNAFKTLNLNVWVDAAESWIEDEVWKRGGGKTSLKDFEGKDCYAGLDIGMTDDFCALCLSFPNQDKIKGWRETVTFTEFYWFFIPSDSVDRRIKSGLHTIGDWILDEHITLADGNYVSHKQVEDKIKELSKRFNIKQLAFDQWNIGSLAENCGNMGIRMLEFNQSMPNFTGPTKWFKEIAADGRLKHGDNPVMRWMIANAVIITDTHENIKVTKDAKRRRDKVDGVIASIMAKGLYYYQVERKTMRIRAFND